MPYKILCELFLQKNNGKIVKLNSQWYHDGSSPLIGSIGTTGVPPIVNLKKAGWDYYKNNKYLRELDDDEGLDNHLYFTELSFFLANEQIIWLQHNGLPFSEEAFNHHRMSIRGDYYSLGAEINELIWQRDEFIIMPRTRWRILHDLERKKRSRKDQTNDEEEKVDLDSEELALYKKLEEENYFKELEDKFDQLPVDEYLSFAEQVIECMWLELEFFPLITNKILDFLGGSRGLPYVKDYSTCGNNIPKIPNIDHPFFKVLG